MITDNNYVVPTAVAMTSAIRNKASHNIYHFYLLINEVTPDNLDRLAQLRRDDVKIDFIEVDASKYSKINVKTHVPQSAALKFDIPDIIKTNKVLYIDGDIIVCKDLEELYCTDLRDYTVAAVRDMGGELKQKFNEKVGVKKYFNSGVLLLNLKKMRDLNCSAQLIKAKIDHPEWKCMDQDAFNFVLSSNTKWLDVKYNSMMALYRSYNYNIKQINKFYKTKYKKEISLEKDSVIIHLAGEAGQRPWKVSNGAFGKIWDEYYRLSPYHNVILQRGIYYPRKVYLGHRITYKLFSFIPLLSIEEK